MDHNNLEIFTIFDCVVNYTMNVQNRNIPLTYGGYEPLRVTPFIVKKCVHCVIQNVHVLKWHALLDKDCSVRVYTNLFVCRHWNHYKTNEVR